jgi:hypothetical protein
MIKKILCIGLLLLVIDAVIFGTSSSHPGPKHDRAKAQIEGLQTYYVDSDSFKAQFQQAPQLDNATFVAITKLDPSVYKRNQKGEVLDPWGQPYIISRNNGQITITSVGLDQYNKLSSLQKWWNNE